MNRWLKIGGAALLAVLLAVLLTRGLLQGRSDAPNAKDRKRAKRLARPLDGGKDYRVPLGPVEAIAAQGIVEPRRRVVKVGAAQPGLVVRVLVKEGEVVQRGDPLLEFDSTPERAAVETATAEVDAAAAQLTRSKGGARPEEKAAAAADARAAKERAALAALTAKRQAELKAAGAATSQDFDQARYQAAAERAAAKALRFRSAAAYRPWSLDVSVAFASYRLARARLAEAQARLSRLTVTAPLAGRVLQLVVHEGEYYTPGTTALLTLGDTSRKRVRLDVDERDVGRLRLGQRGFVQADAFGAQRFPGKLVEIGYQMGRKNVRTDEPTERIDTKILEVVLDLDAGAELVVGQRVVGYLSRKPK